MRRVDDELNQAVNAVFNEGIGLNEPMRSAVLEACLNRQLYFSLQSRHGIFIDTAKQSSLSVSGAWRQTAFQALIPDDNAVKRFIFSTSQKKLNVISCFMVNNTPFYASITISEPQTVQQCLYAGIINLLGLMCIRCQTILMDYVKQLLSPLDEPVLSGLPNYREKLIIKQIAGYSNKVNCTALIDIDGFILNAQGNAEEAEKVASNVALFHQRCLRELGFRRAVKVHKEIFSCDGNTVLIGQMLHTNLTLAISTLGECSRPLASFLFELAQSAFIKIIDASGLLWSAQIEKEIEPARIRNSWFGAAQLVPKGKCVSKKGGKTFHYSSCKILLKSEDDNLDWFNKRVDAIRAGLLPCKACNP